MRHDSRASPVRGISMQLSLHGLSGQSLCELGDHPDKPGDDSGLGKRHAPACPEYLLADGDHPDEPGDDALWSGFAPTPRLLEGRARPMVGIETPVVWQFILPPHLAFVHVADVATAPASRSVGHGPGRYAPVNRDRLWGRGHQFIGECFDPRLLVSKWVGAHPTHVTFFASQISLETTISTNSYAVSLLLRQATFQVKL